MKIAQGLHEDCWMAQRYASVTKHAVFRFSLPLRTSVIVQRETFREAIEYPYYP